MSAEVPSGPAPSTLATPEIEAIWVAAAVRVGMRVERADHAYASSDGRGTIFIGPPGTLDPDDAVAQLVFHELCHAVVEGPDRVGLPDWGLDNTGCGDVVREHACLRLAAHVAGKHGLRGAMAPTTEHRAYHDALPPAPLADDGDPAVVPAREGLRCAAAMGWLPALETALADTASLVVHGVGARHPTGLPWGPATETCGGCAWRTVGGRGGRVQRCRQAAAQFALRGYLAGRSGGIGPRVDAGLRACARWEPPLDCRACGACCREAYHAVGVSARDPMVRRHPHLVVRTGRRLEVLRDGPRCGALDGGGGMPHTCSIYPDRPRACRDFEVAGRHCLEARRRVGISA